MRTARGILAGATLLAAACSEPQFTLPTEPTTATTATQPPAPTADPAAPNLTVSFAGTLQRGETRFYSFTVTPYGHVDVTLETVRDVLGPSTVALQLGLGTPRGRDCVVSTPVVIAAGSGPHVSELREAGVYCARVADTGTLERPVEFTVRIDFPGTAPSS